MSKMLDWSRLGRSGVRRHGVAPAVQNRRRWQRSAECGDESGQRPALWRRQHQTLRLRSGRS